jgi:hypothetical protein
VDADRAANSGKLTGAEESQISVMSKAPDLL